MKVNWLGSAYQVQMEKHSSQDQHLKDGLTVLCLAIHFQVFTNLVCHSPGQCKSFSESTHKSIHAAIPSSEKDNVNVYQFRMQRVSCFILKFYFKEVGPALACSQANEDSKSTQSYWSKTHCLDWPEF